MYSTQTCTGSPRRQARDELFKNPSPDEHNKSTKSSSNVEAVYKTDLIKIRFLGSAMLHAFKSWLPLWRWPSPTVLRIDAMTFGWVEDKDGVRQNVLTSLGVAWILGSYWDHGVTGFRHWTWTTQKIRTMNRALGTREYKGIHRHTKAYRVSL